MKRSAKLLLQLAGLAVWTTAWLGGGLFMLKKAIDKEEANDYGRPKPPPQDSDFRPQS